MEVVKFHGSKPPTRYKSHRTCLSLWRIIPVRSSARLHSVLSGRYSWVIFQWLVYAVMIRGISISPKSWWGITSDLQCDKTGIWLVVDLPLLKNMKVNRDYYSYIWKNKKCSKPPTSYYSWDDPTIASIAGCLFPQSYVENRF